MKSRAISALVFGLCFAIIFTLISLFVPKITQTQCGGKDAIAIYSLQLTGEKNCVGGSTTQTIGLPFASKEKYSGATINYQGLGIDNPSYDWKYNPPGMLLNLLAFWVFGFIFFFIFSRNRSRKIT
ncbi:MAG: hypothetical protein U0R17_04425 [Acidimicrobiia bacterium]